MTSPVAVEFTQVSYTYPDGTPALTDIEMAVHSGEKVALIGPNGSGKSTLLLLAGGFLFGSGRTLIEGIEVNRRSIKQLRTRIGCCLEDPNDQLFMPTLAEDVAFGPLNQGLDESTVQRRVEEALRFVGLEALAHRPPHHLSAGQKRAAALATVLAMKPAMITLDEPDNSLDPRLRNRLADMLTRLDQTLVMASCNMRFVHTVADRVFLMDRGRIVAEGPAENILHDEPLMVTHGLETP